MFVPYLIFRTVNIVRRRKQEIVALVGHVHVTTRPDVLAVILFRYPRFERLVQQRRRVARIPLIQALETDRIQVLCGQQSFQRMTRGPKRLPGFAFVYFRGQSCFDRFKVDQYPRPGRNVFKVGPFFNDNDLFRFKDLSNDIFRVPSREHDQLL